MDKLKLAVNPGEGSCFNVSIPLGKDHLKESEYVIVENRNKTTEAEINWRNNILPDNISDDSLKTDKSRAGKRYTRILIVEDNLDLRKYIKEQFYNEYRD